MIKLDTEAIRCYGFDKWASNLIVNEVEHLDFDNIINIHLQDDDTNLVIERISFKDDYGNTKVCLSCTVRSYVPGSGWRMYETQIFKSPRYNFITK